MIYTAKISVFPRVTCFGAFSQKNGWIGNGARSARHDNLILFTSGECVFEMNNEEHKLSSGDVVFIPAGLWYRPYTESECSYYFVNLHSEPSFSAISADDALNQVTADYRDESSFGWRENFRTPASAETAVYLFDVMHNDSVARVLAKRFEDAEKLRFSPFPGKELKINSIFLLAMADVSEAVRKKLLKLPKLPPIVSEITQYIQGNYREKLTLDGIANVFNLSKQYVMRLFGKHIGMTPTEYIKSVKLKYAVNLLCSEGMNVSQTSDFLGFESQSYFCRVFRKAYGIPPSEYAKENSEKSVLPESSE